MSAAARSGSDDAGPGAEAGPWVAFLRGINVGGHRVTMDRLKALAESAGLEDVRTYIASGNVIFAEPAEESPMGLAARLEGVFLAELGFEVDVHVRALEELEAMMADPEVVRAEEQGFTPHVTFMADALEADAAEALDALQTPDDRFHVVDRAWWWFRRGRMTDSTLKPRDFERAVGATGTSRNLNTVRRIVDKFGAG